MGVLLPIDSGSMALSIDHIDIEVDAIVVVAIANFAGPWSATASFWFDTALLA
jgi:hypothetical protein